MVKLKTTEEGQIDKAAQPTDNCRLQVEFDAAQGGVIKRRFALEAVWIIHDMGGWW